MKPYEVCLAVDGDASAVTGLASCQQDFHQQCRYRGGRITERVSIGRFPPVFPPAGHKSTEVSTVAFAASVVFSGWLSDRLQQSLPASPRREGPAASPPHDGSFTDKPRRDTPEAIFSYRNPSSEVAWIPSEKVAAMLTRTHRRGILAKVPKQGSSVTSLQFSGALTDAFLSQPCCNLSAQVVVAS